MLTLFSASTRIQEILSVVRLRKKDEYLEKKEEYFFLLTEATSWDSN